MIPLRSAFKSFVPPDQSSPLGDLLGNDDGKNAIFPTFEQRESYTIECKDNETWENIKTYLKQAEQTPEKITELYSIFNGKEWFELSPSAANLKNILDACISLWKFRSLNPAVDFEFNFF